MRAVSFLTRSCTSSGDKALGATVQPAITAVTANTTMLRGSMLKAREETLVVVMFKSVKIRLLFRF